MDQKSFLPLGYPVADNEKERLQEILAYRFSEGGIATDLDDICLLGQSLFDVSVVLVSVVGRDTQTFLAKCGLDVDGTAREDSFCTYTILEDDVLIVPDATADPRFAQNRLVTGDMHLRFYAGAPLIVSPGIRIGSLCLIDHAPRRFSPAEARKLKMLAGLVVNELRRHRVMIDVRRQQHLLSQTARMTKVGSWSFDVPGDVLVWSEEAYRIFDVEAHVTPTWSLLQGFWGGESGADIEADIRAVIHVGIPFDRTLPIVTAKGMRRWIRCLAEAEISAGEVTHVIGSFQDISEERAHATTLEWLAFRDPLTALPNRAFFQGRLSAALREAKRCDGKLGLMLFDLDHFKDVNDTLGHEAGDVFLSALAARLPNLFWANEMAFRLGGDEFAVIMPEIADEVAMAFKAKQLLSFLSYPQEQGGRILSLTASVGSAIYCADDRNAEALLRDAEIALAKAKSGGRNRHVAFEASIGREIELRRTLSREVKAGLVAKQFVLYYQPIVEIAAQTVVGFEALMRWNHPSRGVLTPDKFFVAFDDQDLSLMIGEVALDHAMAQMRAWLDAGVQFGRIAVNLSAAQFRRGDLAAIILAKLRHWDVPARCLTLEVTESVYMGWGAGLVGQTINKLHDAGILIALDDFGTGYASLQHISQFPIDRLKIDKSFIRNMENPAIVSAILMLGSGMGMKVVAEGVEEACQLDVLRAMGCDYAQGYFFGRPMPGAAVLPFLETFHAALKPVIKLSA
jgi:diguanylate cyclase (GGDEF)-like protein